MTTMRPTATQRGHKVSRGGSAYPEVKFAASLRPANQPIHTLENDWNLDSERTERQTQT